MLLFRQLAAAAFVTSLAAGAALPASAQDISPPAIDVLSPHLNAIEFGRQNEQAADASSGDDVYIGESAVGSIGQSLVLGLVAPAQASGAARSLDASYHYDRSRTSQNIRTFIQRTPVNKGRAELEQMFAAQPTLFDDLRRALQPHGLDTYNVADAYALWWINAWLVANKRDEDPDQGTIAMVKHQVRNAFAATPDFVKTTDAQRQEYAEALLLQGTMLSSAFEQWKDDPAMLDQVAKAARQGASASDLDLSLMTLTANGFVPRTGADASEAVEGEAAHALAKDGSSEQSDGSDSSMGIALAAGAGLGLVLLAGGVILRKG